jgi:hypothetical protein
MTIWLDELAKAVIEEEARGRRFSETGGPIFGYEGPDGDVVVSPRTGGTLSPREWPSSPCRLPSSTSAS